MRYMKGLAVQGSFLEEARAAGERDVDPSFAREQRRVVHAQHLQPRARTPQLARKAPNPRAITRRGCAG